MLTTVHDAMMPKRFTLYAPVSLLCLTILLRPPSIFPVGSGRTLRETVLESSPVLALLNQSFISSWSLVKELEEMQVSMTVKHI